MSASAPSSACNPERMGFIDDEHIARARAVASSGGGGCDPSMPKSDSVTMSASPSLGARIGTVA